MLARAAPTSGSDPQRSHTTATPLLTRQNIIPHTDQCSLFQPPVQTPLMSQSSFHRPPPPPPCTSGRNLVLHPLSCQLRGLLRSDPFEKARDAPRQRRPPSAPRPFFFFFFFWKKLVMGCCARAAGGLRAGGRAAPKGSAAGRCGVIYGRSTFGPRFLCFSSTDFVFLMVFGTTVGPKLPWTVEAKRVYGSGCFLTQWALTLSYESLSPS